MFGAFLGAGHGIDGDRLLSILHISDILGIYSRPTGTY